MYAYTNIQTSTYSYVHNNSGNFCHKLDEPRTNLGQRFLFTDRSYMVSRIPKKSPRHVEWGKVIFGPRPFLGLALALKNKKFLIFGNIAM